MVDPRLLELLVCPLCKGSLEYITGDEEHLVCRKCSLAFPVKDDIPVMLPEEAVPVEDSENETKS